MARAHELCFPAMRRVLTVLLLIAIIGAASWTVYQWKSGRKAASDPWHAVPVHAAVVIELNDPWSVWDRFTHTSQLWNSLEKQPAPAALGRTIARAVVRLENDAALRHAFDGASVLVAVMRDGSEGIGCVVIGSYSGEVPMAAFGELLQIDGASEAALRSGAVVQVKPDSAMATLSATVRNGLWMLATSPVLMDEALLQLRSKTTLMNDTVFARAHATLGVGVDAHVLVHTGRAQRLLLGWWTAETVDAMDLPEGWLAMDLRTRPDGLLLSGLLAPEKEHAMLNGLALQGTGPWNIARLLPDIVDHWDVRYISDPTAWGDLHRSGSERADSIAAALCAPMQGTVGLATATGVEGAPSTRWLVIGSDDVEEAAITYGSFCRNGLCDTLNYRGNRISQLPVAAVFDGFFGSKDPGFERPWWTVLGRSVVMSAEVESVKKCIDAWNDGNSLAEDKRASEQLQRLSAEAARTLWFDVARSRPLLIVGTKPDRAAEIAALDPLWAALGGASVQLTPGHHGFTHVALGLQHAPLEAVESGMLWSVTVGAAIHRAPDILLNHTNKTREVLVQDTLHRIHLISATGKVLWTRALDGPIMGEVSQVDRFRNGKLQVLFNTASHIHLIDRNGKDVGGFPVDLRSKASAPLAVFDYDGQLDYRVLVPTEDGKLLNYGLDGIAVKGWEVASTGVPCSTPVHHLRIRNKDYLLVIDNNGGIRLLDRRGLERDRTTLVLKQLKTVMAVIPGMDIKTSHIIWSDQDLDVHENSLGDDVLRLAKSQGRYTQLMDLDKDGEPEIVQIALDTLIVRNAKGEVFTKAVGAILEPQVMLYPIGGDRNAIGVISSMGDRTYLFDASGRALAGFPMQGVVPIRLADLNLDNAMDLVIVTKAGRVEAHRPPNW